MVYVSDCQTFVSFQRRERRGRHHRRRTYGCGLCSGSASVRELERFVQFFAHIIVVFLFFGLTNTAERIDFEYCELVAFVIQKDEVVFGTEGADYIKIMEGESQPFRCGGPAQKQLAHLITDGNRGQ